jgi:phosphate-selective porin
MKKNAVFLFGLFLTFPVFAQPSVKLSGYIQSQYQYGEKNAALKVGTANENPDESFSRIGIRRGRIKLTADDGGLASGVFQIDLTEKGLGLKDAYLNIKDPWINTLQVRAGVFDRPFGNEIGYSSSKRESPERSTLFQTLFPDERDLGAMLVLQPAKTSVWNIFMLEAGLFAGNGIKQETDSRKDFIGRLSLTKTVRSDFSYGIGVSYYNGSVYQGTEKVYKMNGKGFELNSDASNKSKFAKREYLGCNFRLALYSSLGITQLRAEYLTGQQPGTAGSSKSPNVAVLPASDTYIRNFNGAYVIFVQDLGSLPFSAALKYDWYDPNTKVSGDEIGENGTSQTDLSYNTFGFGALWKISNAFRLQAFYEINTNEKTAKVASMTDDLKDNIFTLRLQYKF